MKTTLSNSKLSRVSARSELLRFAPEQNLFFQLLQPRSLRPFSQYSTYRRMVSCMARCRTPLLLCLQMAPSHY
jgi:hypothetical protein